MSLFESTSSSEDVVLSVLDPRRCFRASMQSAMPLKYGCSSSCLNRTRFPETSDRTESSTLQVRCLAALRIRAWFHAEPSPAEGPLQHERVVMCMHGVPGASFEEHTWSDAERPRHPLVLTELPMLL